MKTVGLALGGGGARGMAHIVYIKALEELGIKPSIISGSSIGAIFGAMYASGVTADEMAELITKLNFLDVRKFVDFSFFKLSGFLKGNKMIDFLQKNIKASTFEELDIPLKIVATNFWERKEAIFDSGELIPPIRGSMSIPTLFVPYEKDGEVFIDGGVSNPLPFDIIRDDCDMLIAIDITGHRVPKSNKKIIPSAIQCTLESVDMAQTKIIEQKLKLSKPNLFIRPNLINVEMLDFRKVKKILESCQKEKEPFKRLVEKAMKSRSAYFNC